MNNYFEDVVVVESPRVLSKEQIIVYTPVATYNNRGISSFNMEHFTIVNGHVSIKTEFLTDLVRNMINN